MGRAKGLCTPSNGVVASYRNVCLRICDDRCRYRMETITALVISSALSGALHRALSHRTRCAWQLAVLAPVLSLLAASRAVPGWGATVTNGGSRRRDGFPRAEPRVAHVPPAAFALRLQSKAPASICRRRAVQPRRRCAPMPSVVNSPPSSSKLHSPKVGTGAGGVGAVTVTLADASLFEPVAGLPSS